MKKVLLVLVLAKTLLNPVQAQSVKPLSSSDILQALKKLNTVGSVLYVAAHPDDENTRLLAYLAGERKVRTGYLSMTRGDGGQNLIGKEQGELLGLIRTQELLAARRVDGAEQFFTRANDFGYSKNPEETFSFWNKDSILADVVWTIRKFKPEVIICRFPTTGEGGHGHHTASAILALEAFDAAADPKKFPEQLKYTEVWKTKRIFWNTFNFGTTNTTSPDQLKVDVGTYNSLLGKGYGEISAESRTMHKSQGFGSARQRGSNIEFFKFLKGDDAKKDLLEDVNTNWDRFRGTETIKNSIDECIRDYSAAYPEKSLPLLISIYKQIQNLDEANTHLKYWKQEKLKEAETLILACAGLWLEGSASDYSSIPGGEITFTAQVISRNKAEVSLKRISFSEQNDTTMSLKLNTNELYSFKRKLKLPENLDYSSPYWLNEKHSLGLYTVNDRNLLGRPENISKTQVAFSLQVQDLDLNIKRDLIYKNTDPVKGEVYRPFDILPPATVQFSDKVCVFSDSSPKTILLTVKANMANCSGKLQLKAGTDWNVVLKQSDFTLKNKGDEIQLEATITPATNAAQSRLEASLTINGKTYNKSIRRIEYDHIPYQFILSDAEAGLVTVDLKKTNTEIAYIPGAGDDVASSLKQVGYKVTILTDELLASEDFSKYSAILVGIRAYNTNEKLPLYQSKLMDYVKNGGNLVVQYNTNSRVGPLQSSIGPYPFSVSRDRVTNEKAEIRFTDEKHPALNSPNKITQKDFEGWIQERGIYFASEIDKQYQTLLSMNDPGEKASEGSLIIGKYGSGNFVYTGLVFFRELPAGVPGAYRLLVNLLSLPKNQ